MIADVYTTLQGLIYNGFPQNNLHQAIVFDKPIAGWYYGDRSILSESPGVVIQGTTSPQEDAAFGTVMLKHQLTISCWIRADSNALAEQQALEFSRLVYEALLPHRRIWVLTKCPLCPLTKGILTKWSLSPQHYVLGHSGILGKFDDVYSEGGMNSYVALAKHAMEDIWQQTHTTGYSGYNNSGLSTAAFNLLYEDVRINQTPDSVSDTTESILKRYQINKVRPIRLLYDCVFTDIKPCQQNNDKGLFRGGEFTLSAKELIKVTNFGPDNIPTSVWG